jgi:chemotaxis protein CheX
MEINNQQIFDHFSKSTVKILKSMCKTDAIPQPVYKKGTQENFLFDVGGLIGVTSATNRGSIGIYFTEALYLKMISRLYDENATKIDRTNEDAGAEIMNIIFGDAKVTLNQMGHNFRVSIPSVIRGTKISSPSSKLVDVLVFPFQTDAGDFCLEFTLIQLKEQEKIVEVEKKGMGAFASISQAIFFKPFIDATISTLKTMCQVTASTGTPSAKKTSDAFSFDIAGQIGITSESVCGSYMVTFKKEVFLKMMSKMLGEEFKEIEPGMEDGVAELLNIILGHAKRTLNDDYGHAIQMALPTLIHGTTVRSNIQAGKTTIVVPFYSDIGRFVVEIIVNNDKAAS